MASPAGTNDDTSPALAVGDRDIKRAAGLVTPKHRSN